MVIMSVDFGKVRTGLAICDKNEILASPLCVIKEKNEETLAQKIAEKIREAGAESIVIGLPKNMDGSIGESAERVQKLGVVDEIIKEPEGGAHTSHEGMAKNVGKALKRHLDELKKLSQTELLERRYKKYRQMGPFKLEKED